MPDAINILIYVLDSLIAACFLVGTTFYLMVAYSERRAGIVWKLFAASGTMWFLAIFLKVMANMSYYPWTLGTARAIMGLTLGVYMFGLAVLSRYLK